MRRPANFAASFLSATLLIATHNTLADELSCTGCVDTSDIKLQAVTTSRIKNGAVTSGKLANGTVSSSKLRANSVSTPKILNEAVTTEKIADGAITADKLAPELAARLDQLNALLSGGISYNAAMVQGDYTLISLKSYLSGGVDQFGSDESTSQLGNLTFDGVNTLTGSINEKRMNFYFTGVSDGDPDIADSTVDNTTTTDTLNSVGYSVSPDGTLTINVSADAGCTVSLSGPLAMLGQMAFLRYAESCSNNAGSHGLYVLLKG